MEIRDFDEYSGPCEIESDPECDRRTVYEHNDHNKGDEHGNLLTDQSKWTVTVRLYTKKAPDQRSTDIPSVEETGSHYSSGEWPGKSGSSVGSRESAKGRAHRHAVSNGIKPKEYAKKNTKDIIIKKDYNEGNIYRKRVPGRLHYSYSERPLTKEELAQHEKLNKTFNPTYAWTKGLNPEHNDNSKMFAEFEQRLKQSDNGHIFNGRSVGIGNQQKYQHGGSLSQYLSLGTNHYKRSSLRGSNRRKNPDTEDNWQSLCESNVMSVRPKSTMCLAKEQLLNGFENGYDLDSNLSSSSVDSLITDYLVDTEILEDFSGSTHSLNTNTSGKGTSVSTSAKGSETSPESRRDAKSIRADSRHPTANSSRPGAALRRHRSEPFHFLV